ncbi:MAG: Acyltransferase domain protein [Ignavibacteriaceae bacterium]|nr:Acyltransferase domain protein [Ignavibacteriaceae bacterium]
MKEKVRYTFIDLLRGWAILIMIEVHVFNAFLLPELRQTGWFDILTFINGLVAPAFLFVSGFAFQVSSSSRLDDMRKLKLPFWKKLWRYFSIILIGYALHLPFYSLSKVLNRSTTEQLQAFFAVDVLQCIGVGLLILFIIRLLIDSDKIYHFTLIALALFVMVISPFFWKLEFTNYFHYLFANYFNRINGSLFPIFPWINFILVGAIFAKYFLDAASKGNEEKFIKGTTITGVVMVLSGHFFYSGLFPDYLTSIIPHPVFFIERLGYVLVFATLCWYYANWRNTKKSFVFDASRESLLIYWLHLVIIYNTLFGKQSLANIIGQTLNAWEGITATLILMTLMILAAKVWGWIKMKFPKYAGKTAWGVVGVLFVIFIMS